MLAADGGIVSEDWMAARVAETREEFEARCPRPATRAEDVTRVLVRCTCDIYGGGEHWAWGWWEFEYADGLLPPEQTLAEEVPTL
jgi:hypothetical protein